MLILPLLDISFDFSSFLRCKIACQWKRDSMREKGRERLNLENLIENSGEEKYWLLRTNKERKR